MPPATCGVAIDVPLILAVASGSVMPTDVMSTPGANRSTHLPKFENDAFLSWSSVAPTVIADGSFAGEPSQASALSLPAATAYVTPESTDAFTAASSASSAPPPRLMLATAGFFAFLVTQSMPATTDSVEPEPLQSSTRTPKTLAPLARPYVVPAMVPAT